MVSRMYIWMSAGQQLRKQLLLVSLLLMLQGLSQVSSAAVDPIVFDDVGLHKRYQQLTQVLRCPKCQNQSIAGSDAPIATDMRRKVEALLKQGKTNQAIEDYMIDRYGDYVTYNPPLSSRTYILWFAPPFFLIVVGLGFFFAFRQPRSTQE